MKKKEERFVLFMDILGFKDLVNRHDHNFIVKRLQDFIKGLKGIPEEMLDTLPEFSLDKDQISFVIFSDSIIVFSKGNTAKDAVAIVAAAHAVYHDAMQNTIAIKGAISFGEITLDFTQSLFFGQPIIDAFLLHEDLVLLSIIVDHNAEKKFVSFEAELNKLNDYKNLLVTIDVPMKFGKVTHTLLRPSIDTLEDRKNDLRKLYESISGKPRMYLDNTQKFYDSLETSL